MLFSKQQAEQFFAALRAASVKFLNDNGLPISEGKKRYSSWKDGHPRGVTQHFTAGVGWKGTVKWLNDGGHRNSVSCQMLILDRMLPDFQEIASGYPELKDLQVTTLLLSSGIVPCWHAGWVNKFNFGIENRNVGNLKYDDGRWFWWSKNWGAEYPVQKTGKMPSELKGKWWEPYTYGQLCDNILVCQMLYCLYPNMDARWFLPHSATSGRKSDAGPLFPHNPIRTAVFNQTPVSELGWLHNFRADPQYLPDEDGDEAFLEELAERQSDRLGVDDELDLHAVDLPPEANLQLLVQDGKWRNDLGAVRRALNMLGYLVPASIETHLDSSTALAVWIFQKSRKMVADKIPGSKTQEALADRLRYFGLRS